MNTAQIVIPTVYVFYYLHESVQRPCAERGSSAKTITIKGGVAALDLPLHSC